MTDCHVEKFSHMWRNFSTREMLRQICFSHNLCCFVDKLVLQPFTLFCREIYFAAIYSLLHGEKFEQKLRICSKNNPLGVLMGTIAREPKSVAGGMRWCGV